MSATRKALLGFGHGALWKSGALASKLGFVLFVLPHLPAGVFADYSVWSSIALFAALVLSLGSLDGLPILVRGRLAIRDALAPLVQISLLLTLLCFLTFLLAGERLVLVIALVGCNVSYLVLSGVLRSTNPYLFEILTNAPTALFLLISISLRNPGIDHLLVAFFIANFVVPVGVAFFAGLHKWASVRSMRYSSNVVRRLCLRGNAKSASAIIMIVDFRALIITPGFLRGIQPSDALAVALTIAEAFWQFGMVVVNRNYARYCAGGGTLRSSALFSAAMFGLICGAGVLLVLLPLPLSIPKFDFPLIGWAVVMFAAMTALSELRAYFWSRGLFDLGILGVQIAIVVLQVIVVALLPPSYWLPACAIAIVVPTAFLLAGAYRTSAR